MKKVIILSIVMFLSVSSLIFGENNLPLHLKIMATSKPEEPQIWNGTVFLTARPEKPVRFIGVAFDYEAYSIIHPFQINEKGIYIYTGPSPDVREIRYRLVIDGLWMADPLSPGNIKDEYGISVSTLTVPEPEFVKVSGPSLNEAGKTVFTIRSRPDSTVSIVGTFNGWDPYMTPMTETSPGIYTTELRLRSGSYFYYFMIDGKKSMDPMNFARARNIEGEEVCQIDIDRTS